MNDQTISQSPEVLGGGKPIIVKTDTFNYQINNLHSLITHRANQYFASRGYQPGYDLEDWLRAEQEILHPLPIEIRESDSQVVVRAETPGFAPYNIQVSIEPQRIIIYGKKDYTINQKSTQVVYSEIYSNLIFRLIDLTTLIDPESAVAMVNDGVLEIIAGKE